MAPSSYQDVLKLAKDNKCQFIDLKFIDLPGTWQHYTLPIKELADLFENGNGFDGSSIRGFRANSRERYAALRRPDHRCD